MKLRNFMKLMAMALAVPMSFIACSEEEEHHIDVDEIIPVSGVTLNVTDSEMEVGDLLTLSVTVAPDNAISKMVRWSSSNADVAKVDDTGKVTALSVGQAVITVTSASASKTATCTINVVADDGLLVFNGGSYYSSVDGSLSLINYEVGTTNNLLFSTVNGRSLGQTVQDGITFGDNLYIAVHESNTIEVVNKKNFKSVTTIKPDEANGGPRDVVADDNYVYVSMYTGFVSRIDPKTNKIDKTVQVGPNPEEMVIEDGYLYVVNSDGLNYGNNYENGKTVSKIDLKSFTEEKKIPVGLNPTAIHETGDKIFVLCMGNYGDVPASIYTIDKNDRVVNTNIPATFFTAEDGVLYVVDSPWGGSTSYLTYKASDLSVISSAFVSTPVDSPAGIAVDDDRIFISSYNLVNGYASYNTDGYVNEYTMDGTLVKKYDVGVGPVKMAFLD